jgi:hypothetical protein
VAKVFGSFSIKNAVYGAMLESIDCGPFDGGCVVFAMALQRIYGGEVFVIDGQTAQGPWGPLTSSGAQHAILRLPDGRYMDADGDGTACELVSRLNKNECFGRLVHKSTRPIEDEDLPDAPRDETLAGLLAALLTGTQQNTLRPAQMRM